MKQEVIKTNRQKRSEQSARVMNAQAMMMRGIADKIKAFNEKNRK